MFRTVIVTILLVIASPAFAKLYKCEGPDGSVIYTDEPCAGGKELKLPPLQTFTPVKVPEKEEEEHKTGSKDAVTYKVFKITKPANDKAIQDNTGTVDVLLKMEPRLNTVAGHKISVAVDGEPLPVTGTTTLIKLSNIDRGTHSVQAFILDRQGKTIQTSNSVTFHLQRTSLLFPKSGPTAPKAPTVPAAPAAPRLRNQ